MAPPQPTTTKPDVEDDPIVATYNVFIKPPLPQDRKLVVLRYVTKTAQDPSSIKPPRINGFRVKPETGIYEVDIPLETSDGYNKDKGIAWGVALAKSMESKKGGSLGLAGGFNIGGQGGSARGGPGAGGGAGGRRGGNSGGGDDDEAQNLSWPEAVAQGKAVIDQKLTGSRSAGEDYVKHMVGVFQGNNLHLTPVTSLVQLRPVAPYLDAATEQERLARLGPSAAGGAGGPADKQAAGRAIHMSIKSSDSGAAGAAAETMADRLRAVQTEPWHNLKWYHDEHGEAWDTYNECMLLRSSEAANAAPVAEDEVDEEKKKEMKEEKDGEEAAAEPIDDSGAPDLVEKVNRLQSDWGEEQILRSINGLGPDDKKPGEEAVSVPSVFGTKKATVTAAANKVVNSKGKGKVVAAATSSSSNAMQLD
ncbi:Sin-like protein conserved region-domain-containing protein [Neurospora hispaniola]|uniref:Sin-like protein conserved region-domain-containing protein n=1 Tax=Neurospora hispaniola TaxID=588809 RepID=A0AAJ0MN77_9PEZI|nr:Sin-like protein conserved region-domain-containing protein [Neurospora hispaniola]